MVDTPVVLLGILRWIHVVAAAMWVGGGILYLTLARLRIGAVASAAPDSGLGQAFGRTLRLGVAVFIVTGAIMSAARLAEPAVTSVYVGTLAVKLALALVMFWLALPRRRATPEAALSGLRPRSLVRQRAGWITGIGLIVYALSIALNELVESTLRGLG